MKFQLTYEMKPHGCIVYEVEAYDKIHARQIGDRMYKIECGEYKLKKVIVKELK